MLLIFSTLQIVNLDRIITVINTTNTTIFTIATSSTIIVVSHGKENIIFVVKKIVTQTSIQIISNRKQKNFEDKIENFLEIKANTTYF